MADLASLGLDSTCLQVYRALAGAAAATRAQLHARVPEDVRPRLDGALTTLLGAGLVTADGREPAVFVPVAPDLALDALTTVRADAVAAGARAIGELTGRYRERYGPPDPGLVVEVVEGAAAVRRRMEQLYLLARVQVRRLDARANPATRPRPGVSHRTVLEAGKEAPQGEATVRLVSAVPVRLLLCDERFALVGTDPDRMLMVRQPALLRALSALFEAVWQDALPGQGHEPSAEERHILELLATGATDETIGRRLGASTRTVRRRIHELMARIGVSTRLQLGLEASRRGWI